MVMDESVLFNTTGSTGGSGGCFLAAMESKRLVNEMWFRFHSKQSFVISRHKQRGQFH